MHQSSLIVAIVACFVAALTATVNADTTPPTVHKYTSTKAFKPYFCNAYHVVCRRFCSYEHSYVSSVCKPSKNKKYFTLDCNCSDPEYDLTKAVLNSTKETAQRTLKQNLDRDDPRSLAMFKEDLTGDCKQVCKGAKKVTANFTALPKKPDQYGTDYTFKCKCDKHYVNDLVDYWVRAHWDL